MIDRVVVIGDDVTGGGGAAAIALASIRQLRSRGIAVTVLAGGSPPHELAALGVDVVPLGGRHLLDGRRAQAIVRGLYDREVAGRLTDWISSRDTPGTLYHLHNWHKVLSPSAFASLRPIATRLVISAHDFFLSCPNGGFFDFRRGALCERTPLSPGCVAANCDKRYYGHKLWRVARHIVRERLFDLRHGGATILTVHEGMAPLLQRGGIAAGSIRVLRNPVTPWRSERILAERNSAVLFVGRLELDKGVDTAALAARRLGARLLVIGEGPLNATLSNLYPGIELFERQPPEAIGRIAKAARLVVVPTRVRETFGLVALEAAMSGLPVISSSSALITDELVRIGAGLSCAPGDPDELAERIAALLCDGSMVEEMSRRGFAHARDLAPAEDAWGERLLDIYEQTLARSGEQHWADAAEPVCGAGGLISTGP